MPTFDYSSLDPGIRQTVRRIHGWGFRTTDSGDGVSKGDAGERTPHVYIECEPSMGIYEATRLRECLTHAGIVSGYVQFSWSPDDNVGIVSLHGINDRSFK